MPGVAPSTRPARRFLLGLAAITLLGLAIRVGYVLVIAGERPLMGDALSYHLWGEQIAQGNGMVRVSHPQAGSVFTDVVPTAELPPLFPHLVGVVTWLGITSVAAQKLVFAFVGTITVAVLGLVGREVRGDRTGLVAAAIAACYPFLWLVDGSLMSETVSGVWISFILLVGVRMARAPSLRRAVLLGALIGFAGLTRGESLALGPLLALPLGWLGGRDLRQRATFVGASALAVVVVLTPWTIRNLREFEEPVLVSTNSNAVFVGSNCEPTYYDPRQLGLWNFDCYGEAPSGDESQRSIAYRERGFQYALDHLDRVPIVMATRFARVWELYHPLDQAHYEVFEGRPYKGSMAGLVAFYPLVAAAVCGAVVLRRDRRLLIVLLAPIVQVSLVAIFVYGSTRFRFAAEPALVVLGAVGVVATIDRIRSARGASPRPRAEGLQFAADPSTSSTDLEPAPSNRT